MTDVPKTTRTSAAVSPESAQESSPKSFSATSAKTDSVTSPVPLAIIGIGCMFPKAPHLGAFWANIREGVDAITEVPDTHWNPGDYFDQDVHTPDKTYARRGGFLEPYDFDPLAFGISPNNLEATDTTQLLGMVAARAALDSAGYAIDRQDTQGRPFDRDRTSVILGVTGTLELVIPLGARLGHPLWRKALADAGVDEQTAQDVVARIAEGYVPWQENSFPGLLGNVAAGRIANRFDLGGTNCVVDAACASSLGAIHLAAMELQTGRSDMVITGGLDTFNDIFMYMCFSKTPAMSPTGDVRPFSQKADGTLLGEGLGVVILKRLEDAQRDQDRIFAVLRAIGTSSDGRGNAIYAPSATGQTKALEDAYRQARLQPRDIELIEAHGTGTKAGDATEIKALTNLYRQASQDRDWCAVGTVKSMIGHTKAAAGVAGLIKTTMALHHKILPPTLKVEQPADALQPHTGPLYVNTHKRPWFRPSDAKGHAKPRRAAVSAFGFGGSNFHAVLEEAPDAAKPIDWDARVLILPFSADAPARIQQALDQLEDALPWQRLGKLAHEACQKFDASLPCRLVMVLEQGKTSLAELKERATKILTHATSAGASSAETLPPSADLFFSWNAQPGKLAALFPGQGAQRVGMLNDLTCQFPQMFQVIESGNDAVTPDEKGKRLSDYIYPIPVFTEADRDQQEADLRQTRIAQPALGAVSLGAWRVLEYFGVQADLTAGHSFGELVALCAAGRMTDRQMLHLAQERGRLMAEAGEQASDDPGAMLAVFTRPENLGKILGKTQTDLVLANHNSPDQVVLSGPTAQIVAAQETLEKHHVRTKRLEVAAAFHSALVAEAAKPFAKAMAKIKFAPGQAVVYANTTAKPYPQDAKACMQLLANQLAKPVQFVDQVRNLYQAGARTFLEVGPNRHLSGMIRKILDDASANVLSLDRSGGKRSGQWDLAMTLAQLASLGYPVKLNLWNDSQTLWLDEKTTPRMAIPLSGANYVKQRPTRPPVSRAVTRKTTTPVTSETPMSRASQQPDTLRQPLTRSSHVVSQQPPQSSSSASQPDPQAQLALSFAQQSILALQKLQEQTANLHHQYLANQQVAQQSLQQLIQQQMQFMGMTPPAPPAPPASPAPPVHHAAPLPPVPPAPPAHPTPSVPHVAPLPSVPTEPPVSPEPPAPPAHAVTPASPAHAMSPADQTPPVPTVPVTETSTSDDRGISDVLLEIVSDKTGYPVEMLELEMSLDADLGIDSIKRVEILSALQEARPDTPQVQPDDMGALQTLGDIVAFLEKGGDEFSDPFVQALPRQSTEESVEAATARSTTLASQKNSALDRHVLETYPLDSATCKRRSWGPDATILITEDGQGVAQQLATELNTRKVRARVIALDQPIASLFRSSQINSQASEQTVLNTNVAGLVLVSPLHPGENDLTQALQRMKEIRPLLQEQAVSLLAAVVRLDGQFGLGRTPNAGDPWSAALGGMVKTAHWEWPDVHCKVIDAGESPEASEITRLADQLLATGPLEVGLSRDGMVGLTLRTETLAEQAGENFPLTSDDTVIITGGARGVTAQVAVQLAKATSCHLILLGRSPAPVPEPTWLTSCRTEAEIKKALLQHAEAAKRSPREIQQACRQWMAGRQIRATLEKIQQAGSQASYYSCDVVDPQAVAQVMTRIRQQHPPVRGLIHGAGILADRLIVDKTSTQFEKVFKTKVVGLENLLTQLENESLRVLVMFASSTGRFGRKGQSDYAAANEVLNKIAQQQAMQRPDCRVLSINWGPWDGGMVTASLKQLFAEEGIATIDLQAGARYLVNEIAAPGGGPVELVILGKGSQYPDSQSALFSQLASPPEVPPAVPLETPSAVPPEAPSETPPASFPEVSPASLPESFSGRGQGSNSASSANLSLAFERVASLEAMPVLSSHVLGGQAVMPAALMVEWLAHAAMSENPGMALIGLDDFRVFKGVRLGLAEELTLEVLTGLPDVAEDQETVLVEIRSVHGPHARAQVILGASVSEGTMSDLPWPQVPYRLTRHQIYAEGLLFHGPDLQAIDRVLACDAAGISAKVYTSPSPAQWFDKPSRTTWLTDPLAMDAAFALMILWTRDQLDAPSLPTGLASYRQYCDRFPQDGLTLVCRPTDRKPHQVTADIQWLQDQTLLAEIRGYTCVVDKSLDQAFAQNQLQPQTHEVLKTNSPAMRDA